MIGGLLETKYCVCLLFIRAQHEERGGEVLIGGVGDPILSLRTPGASDTEVC